MARRRRQVARVERISGGPDLGMILNFHRGQDSWVRFSKAEGKGLVPIAHLQVSQLREMFPEYRDQLVQDAYFSLNSFYREGTAKTDHLRYLNTAYADLDYYKAGTDRPKAATTNTTTKAETPARPQIEANPERGQRGSFVKITLTIGPEMLERVLSVGVQRKARKAGEPSATSEMIREAVGEWLERQ